MTFDQFVKTYDSRLESYIRRYARTFGIRGDGLHDLRQEAHLAAFRALSYWREGDGHKSAFNWCAGPMRRAMEKAVRREFGLRPCTNEPIRNLRADFDDCRVRYTETDRTPDLENIIDLKTALVKDRKPQQIVRLIMSALSPDSEVDFAARHGISRQSMWASNDRAKARLRRALG
jgi:DNA-directed RNA polymerase specialized sigma24 family protein